MTFTGNFYSRMLGAFVFAYLGYRFGIAHSSLPPTADQQWATSLLVLAGAGLGLLLTQHLTLYPFRNFRRLMQQVTIVELVAGLVGLVGGLLVGVLFTIPLSRLPEPFDAFAPVACSALASYFGMVAGLAHKHDLAALIKLRAASAADDLVLLDTSVIIDGRVAELAGTGFLGGTLVVPTFVLHELQQLADSRDDLTRAKGKRGLGILQSLQASQRLTIEVRDLAVPALREVDDKLVAAARAVGARLLTNDANLAHVAALQGVTVLNINELADAVRLHFQVGDQHALTLRNEGRERDQAVGYMPDGTMVVVEDARRLIGQTVQIVVSRLYTTATGRIVFAELARSERRDGAAARVAA